MTRTVLISGAGIAGTTLAYWLRRNGFQPTVVERAEALRTGGYKVDIRGAALEVVRRMGLLNQLRSRRTEVCTGSVVDARGRRVASMDADTFGGRVHQDCEVLRGDLAGVLAAATGDVEYVYGDAIAELADGPDGVTVTFASGTVRRFDLVVGADGLHSVTRSLVVRPEPACRQDLGYRVAIYSVPNHLGLDREELTYVAPGRTALVYSTARDTGAKAMFLFRSDDSRSDEHRSDEHRSDEHRSGDGDLPRDRSAQQRLLAAAYAGQGWEVPRLLSAMDDAPDFYLDSLSQIRLDRYSAGRVALVGDAAYCASPASGQGTSLALVGGYVLAGELAAHADHGAAFAGYEARMRPFVAANQALGPANIKRMVLASKAQVRMSMAMLSLVSRLPGRDRMLARVTAPIHRAANAIDLPSYR